MKETYESLGKVVCLWNVNKIKICKIIISLSSCVNFQEIIPGKAAAEGILYFYRHLKIFITTSLQTTQ